MDSTGYDELKKSIMDYLRRNLKESRLQHTLNVAETAKRMAVRLGADEQKAELAALLHDMARNMPLPLMNEYVGKLGLHRRYLDNPNLSHSKIAAALAESELGVWDRAVIDAIAYHTTGRAGMTLLERIIFLADAIEPGREYPGVEELRKTAEIDPDRACLASLAGTIDFIGTRGIAPDPDTLAAKEYFTRMEEE